MFSWSEAELALVSGLNCISSTARFSLLALVLEPGHISFPGLGSRFNVCPLPLVLVSGYVSLVLDSRLKCLFH